MRVLSSVSRLEFGVLSSAIAIIILMAAWRAQPTVFANRHNGEVAAVNQATPVTTVSAASFAPIVAPDSIAASFGGRLATQVAQATTNPLPTSLAGTTVKVNGVMAGLFYVSSTQVNYHIPPETKPGAVSVVITSGDGAVSMGTMRVEAVTPGVFTTDGSGQGTPAALILRALPNGDQRTEPISMPIDLGPPGERVFLILFLTGVRGAVDGDGDGNLNETAHVLLGGSEITPAYAGQAPTFVGLDQINVEIPRSLIGRGAVDLRVNYSAITQSNIVRIEIGGPPPSIRVTGFDPATALVGDEVTINGANFAANANDNQVYFVDEDLKNFQARVNTANQTQITAIVPFGAGSGPTLVRMPQSEVLSAARLVLRTSISGFVETTEKQPIPGMTARVREPNISARTGGEGKFILPDVPPGLVREVEIDSSSSPLPFPKYATTLRVLAGRDHHLARITLRQIDGPSIIFTPPGSLAGAAPDLDPTSATGAPTTRSIQLGGVVFEVADNTTAIFPSGMMSESVSLNLIGNSRTPAKLPSGIFSSTIVQLAPFGVRLAPGGKLTFPNSDNLPVNSQPRLYKLDQTSGSPTLGEFIESGAATVSADGQRVETATNAISETSIYFAAIPRPVTNIVGRVVESDGVTALRGASVSARGQRAVTDGTGLYLLLNVPTIGANDQIAIEASFQRPGGRVDRARQSGITPLQNGTTRAPDLVLTSPSTNPNRPPAIIAPSNLSVTEGVTLNVDFVARDPDEGQTIEVTSAGAPFASVSLKAGNVYTLRLAPGASAAGNYMLSVKATDNQAASATQNILLTVNANRPPALSAPGPVTAQTGQNINFTVSATDPDAGQTLTFSATELPSGAAFNPATRRFSWTPTAEQFGGVTVSFKVSDNGLTPLNDSKSVTISVIGQWAQLGPYGGNVTALLVNGTNLFAGTNGGGVFLTTNNGQSWTPVNNGLTSQTVLALAVSGSNLLAGTYDGGVFLSTNNGQSWTAINNGLTDRSIYSLVVSGNRIFAGTFISSVFVTQF